MIDLYQYENVLYGQSDDYLKVISNVEKMILNSKDQAEKDRAFRFLNVLLQVHGARTPTSEYLLKQLATAENRDIITTGNLLHLGNCIQEEPEKQSSPDPSLTLSVEKMAKQLGIGRTKAYALVRSPGFPAIKVGNRTLVDRDGLTKWLAEKSGKENGGDV